MAHLHIKFGRKLSRGNSIFLVINENPGISNVGVYKKPLSVLTCFGLNKVDDQLEAT